ncbi:hypothetical protein, partial [Thiobacillus sp.]
LHRARHAFRRAESHSNGVLPNIWAACALTYLIWRGIFRRFKNPAHAERFPVDLIESAPRICIRLPPAPQDVVNKTVGGAWESCA